MKKGILMLTTVLLGAAALAQNVTFTKLFKEEFDPKRPNSNQGSVIVGDYLFQFRDKNAAIDIYRMTDGASVYSIPMEFTKTFHNNNVEASAFYYEKGDEFPVIYASQENKAEHKVVAYRIWRNGDKFDKKVVQVINLPAPVEMGVYFTNVILDIQKNRMYITGYSADSWKSAGFGNGLVLLEFALPSPFEGEELTLTTKQILSRRNFPFRVATQGASIRNGRIYQVYGVPGYGPTSLVCTDIESGRVLWDRDLPSCGIDTEPEGLSFYKDELIVIDVKGNVYSSGIFVPWELPEGLKATAPALARGAKKRLVCLDLDATLTQHRTPLEDFNRNALHNLDNRYKCIMVCAGNCPRVWKQMGNYPIDILGNYGMQEAHVENGELVMVKQITQPADTAFFLKQTDYLRKKYGYTQYDGASVEFHASGMVTFGLLGTTAAAEQKVVFDPDRAKRKAMYPEVKKIFKKYSIFIGGSSSFDFAGKKFNKYDAVVTYAKENGYKLDEIIFIGDDFGDGGGDSHVRLGGLDYICIDDYRKFATEVAPLLIQK